MFSLTVSGKSGPNLTQRVTFLVASQRRPLEQGILVGLRCEGIMVSVSFWACRINPTCGQNGGCCHGCCFSVTVWGQGAAPQVNTGPGQGSSSQPGRVILSWAPAHSQGSDLWGKIEVSMEAPHLWIWKRALAFSTFWTVQSEKNGLVPESPWQLNS